jgi:hypothetical protein
VLALAGEAVGDPHPGELGHAAGDEAGLFAQLAARELFGIVDLRFPATLGQLEGAFADGVAELLDEPDVIAIDGKDGGAVMLVDDAVDAVGAIGTFDRVFADGEPVVAIDLAGGEGADGHEVRMPRSRRPVLAARANAGSAVRANAPAARVVGVASFGRSHSGFAVTRCFHATFMKPRGSQYAGGWHLHDVVSYV